MENNKSNYTTGKPNATTTYTANETGSTTATSTLHQQFKRLGRERNKITYKLLSLLPQIAELEIYKKYNYPTIYEYAGKLAGLSHSVVEKTLAAHKNLKGKPHLQKAIESEGIHKVALVANLATPKTDRAWADKVKNMSKHSLGELAREMRMRKKKSENSSAECATCTETATGITTSSPPSSAPCHAAPATIKIELDKELEFTFLKLKNKFGSTLSNKEVLRRIFKEVEETTSQKNPRGRNRKENKESVKQRENDTRKIVPKQNAQKEITFPNTTQPKKPTRYIPTHIKKAALQRSGGKCAYPNCQKPTDVFHHTKRFSETKNHQSVTPLCKAHHEFAHSGLIMNEKMAPHNWQLKVEAGVGTYADAKFRHYHRE